VIDRIDVCRDRLAVRLTTSMGVVLTLNVLLCFAQFEREVTSERITDKIAAAKRRGLWIRRSPPLGYDMKDGKIIVLEHEAEQVGLIYRRYLELSGVNALVRHNDVPRPGC
jgi:site-specific DNA recombinase